MPYIHELKNWPRFEWDRDLIMRQLLDTKMAQGLLLGRMRAIGLAFREEASVNALSSDVIKTSEIEGEQLNVETVRSSVARHLGIETGAVLKKDRDVEGVVEMMLDATQNYTRPLSAERLYRWHEALFPLGTPRRRKLQIGRWRDDRLGPMQVVSGGAGREKVHYQAPDADLLDQEMKSFVTWFNKKSDLDLILKAAISHLWFVTIHPFDDGNGRIARALADLMLSASEKSSQRFYSMSAQIQIERKRYYEVLESTQKGDLDITEWLEWFLVCLQRAFVSAEKTMTSVLAKARFWETHASIVMNERQKKMVLKLLEGLRGQLTSTKWAKLTKCSQDTAHRDIEDLIRKKILRKEPGGGRSTSYSLVV